MKKILFCTVLFLAFLDPFKDYNDKGIEAYGRGEYEKALQLFEKASSYSAPANSLAALEYNKAKVYAAMKKESEAVDSYMKAASAGDDEIKKKSFFNLGNIYAKSGRKKEAAENYIAALKVDPEYDKARKNLEYLSMKNQNDNQDNQDNQSNQSNQNDQNNKNSKGKSGENKDNNKNKNNNKGEKNDDKSGDNQSKPESGNTSQIDKKLLDSILESMKKNPVRKSKGEGLESFGSEKNW
ncbi:MAG TPA: tetratricopeptide repeat protein [Spirochaetota bacterium]|jgi:tetratricopeptide (TPR) repeat protein|nr:tetratricopeptide repeat protein [Spirochaetota bacterium]HOH37890.1 tetratricopeptide repeat protein [Spirochaetota bacterium]